MEYLSFRDPVGAKMQKLFPQAKKQRIPSSYSEALRLAAELAEQNEKLESQLAEIGLSNEYPEVLQSVHLKKLFGWGDSTISQYAKAWGHDPNSPLLNKGRNKGEKIFVLKTDLYRWMKDKRNKLEPREKY